eukprot:Gb_27874 [translate_table: standard]
MARALLVARHAGQWHRLGNRGCKGQNKRDKGRSLSFYTPAVPLEKSIHFFKVPLFVCRKCSLLDMLEGRCLSEEVGSSEHVTACRRSPFLFTLGVEGACVNTDKPIGIFLSISFKSTSGEESSDDFSSKA